MRTVLALVFSIIGLMSYSQSRQQILDELGELLESQGNPSELFYVESEGFLDIQGHQVKLRYVQLRYQESDGPMLGFYCPVDCIYNPKANETMRNFAFRMKDKSGVYKAIDLINQIENASDYKSTKQENVDALMGGFSDSKGKETGDPNASGYYGIRGDGSGGNYKLGNRRALTRPIPEYDCNKEGKVVVKVYVDQTGKVISAESGIKGSTTSARCLLDRAKEAALRTKFNSDSNAPAKQAGQIIYNFRLSE